ncbi:hypothetical protein Hte_004832 [Hypoxylon texense]
MRFFIPILALCACTAAGTPPEGQQNFIADLKALLAEVPPSDDVDFNMEIRDLLAYHFDHANVDVSITPSGMSATVPTAQSATHQHAPRCVIADPNPSGAEGDTGDSSAGTLGDNFSIFGLCVFLVVALTIL